VEEIINTQYSMLNVQVREIINTQYSMLNVQVREIINTQYLSMKNIQCCFNIQRTSVKNIHWVLVFSLKIEY
jgi:hypothetical protein